MNKEKFDKEFELGLEVIENKYAEYFSRLAVNGEKFKIVNNIGIHYGDVDGVLGLNTNPLIGKLPKFIIEEVQKLYILLANS
jgi:hypothetical protein